MVIRHGASNSTLLSLITAGSLIVTACGGDDTAATSGFAEANEEADETASGGSEGNTNTGDGDGDGDSGDGDGDDTNGEGTKFDIATFPDGGGDGLECGCGNTEWSYIWIANSGEHTVSKINTRTMVEEGRYYTRADQSGNPSRTSVSIDARAVVVANRFGGVTKIWAREADCVDKNNNGMIDTSTGPLDVRPFDEDECIAWHSSYPGATVQRPVAWTSGVLNLATCEYENQKIWTSTGADTTMGPGYCGPSGTWVHRLNADTGVIEDTVHIPESDVQCASWGGWGFGFYGGAVDPDNNMWLSTFGAGKLVRVNYDTLEYTVFNGSSYGVTVDTMGRPWVGDSPSRFNPGNGSFDPAPNGTLPGAGGSGIAEDHEGRMWAATSGGIGWVDRDTLTVGDTVLLPAQGLYRGISVDVDGFIWAIPLGGTEAFKVDPDTYTYESVGGLNSPYSYSDMTGGQLNSVNCNQPEG